MIHCRSTEEQHDAETEYLGDGAEAENLWVLDLPHVVQAVRH